MTQKPKKPFKEVRPYEVEDEDIFAGREKEKKILLRLIRHNILTVIHGTSGIGKTSLLKAGLLPQLIRDGYLPLPLRVNYRESDLLEL